MYIDASALVKLYGWGTAGEAGVRDAEVVATCELAYVEVRAALAPRYREGALTSADYRRALRDLHTDWPQFFLITVGGPLVGNAGALTERYRLRAYL